MLMTCLTRFTTYMKPQYILSLAAYVENTLADISNAELRSFISQYETPETVTPLTRCQVKRLQSLLRDEVETEPSYRRFVDSNVSLPVKVEFVPSEELVSTGDDFDVFVGDLDRKIEAMLTDFYGPASEESC